MAFQLSPGVNISEIDLTTVVPSVATTDAAIGGIFRWGPVEERVLVTSEKTLVERFGKPNNNNAETFFSAANFLAYGNRLYVARAASMTNADSTSTTFSSVAVVDGGTLSNSDLLAAAVKNSNDYENKTFTNTDVVFVAKYPGAIGNSLKVSVCDSLNAYSSNVTLANGYTAVTIGSNTGVVKFSNTAGSGPEDFANAVATGDYLLVGNTTVGEQYLKISSVTVGANAASNVDVADANVNITSNFITFTNDGFANGDYVTYSNTDGSEIGGLTNGAEYYVVEANTTGFKLSTTPFGSEIDITASANSSTTHNFLNSTRTATVNFSNTLRLKQNAVSTGTVQRFWEFYNVVDAAPGQSTWQAANGNTSAQDELHVVIVDEDGEFSGSAGTILEVFQGVSRATDAKNEDNSVNYYKEVINDTSNYIWYANDLSGAASNTATNLATSTNVQPTTISMAQGADGLTESTATLAAIGAAYDLFASAEDVDISLVIQGKPIGGSTTVNGETVQDFQLANYIIDNICEVRKDCIALISPPKATVLNNLGSEAISMKNWRGAVRSTSYAVLDSGYKYQYDRYNDLYRWIPINGDVAGLCAQTDATNDAWWSPAGFNRGNIKNIIKLAWNPSEEERNILYPNGINPIVTFPGQGTVLFGDKTLQAKPSAFDRINVRRLFIVLEKAIATSARYSLFEFNDPFTRSQFKNLVTPFLRNIQGRRGITDFLVICDETNNTPQVVDSNQFVGDIYIKPARSINFIQLNFVAVGSGVQFSEVVTNNQ